jgi:hypothetical protein
VRATSVDRCSSICATNAVRWTRRERQCMHALPCVVFNDEIILTMVSHESLVVASQRLSVPSYCIDTLGYSFRLGLQNWFYTDFGVCMMEQLEST